MKQSGKNLPVLITSVFYLLFSLMQVNAQDLWLPATDFGAPSPRKGAATFKINNNIYVFGGRDATNAIISDLWKYNSSTDSWTLENAACPVTDGRAYAAAFAIGTKAYIVGGLNNAGTNNRDVWQFNSVNGNWTLMTDSLPGGKRQGLSAFVIGQKAYVGLGVDGATFYNDFYEFDGTTGSWTQVEDFPGVARAYNVAFSIGSTGYAGIGWSGVFEGDFYAYNPTTDDWSQIADYGGTARLGASSFIIDGKAYVGMGDDGSGLLTDFWWYEPVADAWSSTASLQAEGRREGIAFALGDIGYAGTGSDNGTTVYAEMWKWMHNYCNLEIDATVNQISCNADDNGEIQLNVSGGATPYTFNWNNGSTAEDISNLAPGYYGVTITDNEGCIATRKFRLNEPTTIGFGKDSTVWQYAYNDGGNSADMPEKMVTDRDGNLYITGYYSSTATFGSTSLTSFGGTDIFIAKYNNIGNLSWVVSAGGTLNDKGSDISIDSLGNVYVIGTFREMAFFDGNQVNSSGSGSGSQDKEIFIAKYAPDGTFVWVKTAGGFFDDQGFGIFTVPNGDSYITGSFQGNADFQSINMLSNGGDDIFAAKINTNGVFEWAEKSGGTSEDFGYEISRSSYGNIILSGTFQSTASFGAESLTSQGDDDIFILSYDQYGNQLWVEQIGGPQNEMVYDIQSAQDGYFYLTGSFKATATFGVTTLTSAGLNDIFISRYDTDGNHQWSKRGGGSQEDYGRGLSLDHRNNIYFTGAFSGNASIDTMNLSSQGGLDIITAAYNASGDFFRGVHSPATGNVMGTTMVHDTAGNFIIAGYMESNITFGDYSLTNLGNKDIFYAQANLVFFPEEPEIVQPSCAGAGDGSIEIEVGGGTPPYSFAWSHGAVTQNVYNLDEGSYMVTITDALNCTKDTTIVLENEFDAPVPPNSASVDRSGFCWDDPGDITLSTEGGSGTTLTWLKDACTEAEGGIIIGTGSPLTIASPESTTTYFARWETVCDTSSCVEVEVISLGQPTAPEDVTAYPDEFCELSVNFITLSADDTGHTGELLAWYDNRNCIGDPLQTGTPVDVAAPSASTWYYVRWETDGCGNSDVDSVQVLVLESAIKVDTAYADTSEICLGYPNLISLSAEGGYGQNLIWAKGSCDGIQIGSGSPLLIDPPTDTTTYYVYWNNYCGPSECDSITINVLQTPASPSGVTADYEDFCIGEIDSITLTAIDAYGGDVVWYKGYCGLDSVASGETAKVIAPTAVTTYYARVENFCGSSPYPCPYVIVTPHQAPVANFTGLPENLCLVDEDTQLTGIPSGADGVFTTTAPAGLTDNGDGTASFNPFAAGIGIWDITYTYTNADGCIDDSTRTVTVNPLPVVNFTGLTLEGYCVNYENQPIQLNGTPPGANGTFTGQGITDNGNGTASFMPQNVAPGGPYDIQYTYTDNLGCTDSIIKTVLVYGLTPTLDFTVTEEGYCENADPIELIGNQSGNPANAGYFLGNGIQPTEPGKAFFVPPLAGPGIHDISYIYTNANGCTYDTTRQIEVYALPNAYFTGLLETYCFDANPTQLIGHPTNTNGVFTFDGPEAGVQDNGNGTAVFYPDSATAGTWNVTYSYLDDITGCSNDSTRSVTVYDRVVVSIDGLEDHYCVDAEDDTLFGSMAPQGSFGPAGAAYLQDLSDGRVIFKPSIAGVGSHPITYTWEDGMGCTGDTTITAVVVPLPTATVTSLDSNYCFNAIPDTIYGNHQPDGFFTITPGGGLIDLGDGRAEFTPSLAEIGYNFITYSYTDPNGCTKDSTFRVNVWELPVITISGFDTTHYCYDTDTMTISGTPFTDFSVGFTGNGFSDNDPATGTARWTAATAYDLAGMGPHSLSYSTTDANGCTVDTSWQIFVNALPVVGFSGLPDSLCVNADPITLTANTPNNLGTFSGNGIQDLLNGTALFDPGSPDVTPGTFVHITFAFTDYNNCYNDTTDSVYVIPLPVKPDAIISDTNDYCAGIVTDLTLSVDGGWGDSIQWFMKSCGDSLIGTTADTFLTVTAPTDTTWYWARWKNDCAVSECDSVQILVKLQPLMLDSVTVDINDICAATTDSITLTAHGGFGDELRWYADSCGGDVIGTGTPLRLETPPDTITYYARYESTCDTTGCQSITVNISPQPIIPDYLTVDINNFCATEYDSISLMAFGGYGEYLEWYTPSCGDSLLAVGDSVRIPAPLDTSVYFARWINGCDTTDCLSIQVDVRPLPIQPDTIYIDTNDFCALTVELIHLSAEGGFGDFVEWRIDSCNGPVVAQGNPPQALPAPVDTTVYYATYVNNCGYSACDSIIVNVRPQPIRPDTIYVDTNFFCPSYSGLINLTVEGGLGDTLVWRQDSCTGLELGRTFGGINTLSFTAPDTSTSYFVSYINSCNESNCISMEVTVNEPLPFDTIVADTAIICFNDPPVEIILNGIGGRGETVRWFKDECNGEELGIGNPFGMPPPDTTTTYYGRWENECGVSECTSIRIIVIEAPTPPDTLTTSDDNFCAGSLDFITLSSSGGVGDTISGLGDSLRWFEGACGINSLGTGEVFKLVPPPLVTTTYYARWENRCAVSECDSVIVHVNNPEPVDSITVDTNYFCPGGELQTITLTAHGGVGDVIMWFQDECLTTPLLSNSNPFITAAPDTTTTYYATWRNICDTAECVPFTVTVNIPLTPDSIVIDTNNYCSDYEQNITLEVLGGRGDIVRWYTNSCQGTPLGSGNPLVIPPFEDSTTVYALWENYCGLSECDSLKVNVVPHPELDAGPQLDSLCETFNYPLEAAWYEHADSILWTVSNDYGYFEDPTDINTTYIPENEDITQTVKVWLHLDVFGISPCAVYSDSIELNINPTPVLSIMPEQPMLCRDSSIQIIAKGAATYLWTPATGLDTIGGSTVISTLSADQQYRMYGTSTSGCVDSLDFTIPVLPPPFVNLGEDLYLFTCEPVTLNAGNSDGNHNYLWSNGSRKQTIEVSEDGAYYVTVWNDACATSDSIMVELCDGFMRMPNAFTPNNDGVNEIFKPVTSDPTVIFEMRIYNRNGRLVFQTEDVLEGWNGNDFEGTACPQGIYVWQITYEGEGVDAPGYRHIETGRVTLLR